MGGVLNPAAPPDPLAGLLPQDPVAGLLPSVPSPRSPALPDEALSRLTADVPTPGAAGAGTSGQRGGTSVPGAPGDAAIPVPPKAPDCECTPSGISVSTGELTLTHTDRQLL